MLLFCFIFSLQQKKQLQKQRRNNVEQLVVNHVVLEMTETCRDFVTGIAETIYPHGSSTNAYLHVSWWHLSRTFFVNRWMLWMDFIMWQEQIRKSGHCTYVGGHSHIKVTGVHLPTHQIKGAISDNFLERKGSVGERSEKGVIRCETAQNQGNFNTFFWKFSLRFVDLTTSSEHFDQRCRNRGLLGVKL